MLISGLIALSESLRLGVGGEGPAGGAVDVLGTFLHQASALAHVRGAPRRAALTRLSGRARGETAQPGWLVRGPCCHTSMALPAGSSVIATQRSPSG
jgi:hypothetical protein